MSQTATSNSSPSQGASRSPAGKEKILRACVVQGGKVIEEQRLGRRDSLTIGTHPKNTFVVASNELPRSHQLFVVKGGKYELVITEAMRGRISVERQDAIDFSDLKTQGKMEKRGDYYHLPLSDGHRGKVLLGDTTLIFQFVVPPPAQEKAVLPASLRYSPKDRVDVPYALALALCILVELPLVVYFQYAPQPEAVTLETMNDRWSKLIAPEIQKKEAPKPPDQKGDQATEKEPEKVAEKKEPEVEDEPTPDEVKQKQQKRAKARDEIQGKGLLAILGTKGAGGASGAVADVFGDGGIGGDLDGAFDGISGVGVAKGGGKSSRGGGSGEAAGIGDLATSGGGKVKTGQKKTTRVAAVKTEAPEVDGSLDSAAIAKVVRRRIKSLQDCYERELKRDPALSGKIEIEFTIGESGRVDEARVSNNGMGSKAVGSCIVSRVRRWRFPTPDGGSVTVNYPFIFTPSG